MVTWAEPLITDVHYVEKKEPGNVFPVIKNIPPANIKASITFFIFGLVILIGIILFCVTVF